MKTKVLDARSIPADQSVSEFFCSFYDLPAMTLPKIREYFYKSDQPIVTEVFHWPVDSDNWKEIALQLESLQQHSPVFYVIWGPETTDAITYETDLAKQKEAGADASNTNPTDHTKA